MKPPVVIVLSSSPPSITTSQGITSRNKATVKKVAGHGLCTPTKNHKDIWKIPSSPLPSPEALLRGLQQPKARRASQSKLGKSFKTARELLEAEEQRGDLLFEVDDNQHAEEYAAIVPEETPTRAKSVAGGKRAKVLRKTTTESEKTVKKTATVSSHFSKKSKTSNAGKGSKSLSSVGQTNSGGCSKAVSLHADVTKPTQERVNGAEAGLEVVPMLSVLARRRDWTPVKNTVPVVEIMSSPMVQRAEYEADIEEAELEDFTTGAMDESTSPKQRFGDKIGLFKFDSNNTSAPSIGATFASAGLSSTLGTTKRCIQVCSVPSSTLVLLKLTIPTLRCWKSHI